MVKIEALEWDDFVLQKQLKSLMYVNCSSHGNPKKGELIDELNFKNCMRLRRKTTRKLFVGKKYQKRKFIIHPEYFNDKNIFSHPYICNLKHKPNMFQYLSIKIKVALKKQILENSVKYKIYQILHITRKNGKT